MDKQLKLFPEQQEAKDAFGNWYNQLEPDTASIFRIFGYAGTGKTTITQSIIKEIEGKIVSGAFTGKAALVMQRSGLPAKTIHSLIYIPITPDKKEADKIRRNIQQAVESIASKAAIKGLYKQLQEAEQMHFELNSAESDLLDAKLLVLDECSMVNDAMMQDILSFKVPLLVLGDPGQLPPVKGTGALTQAAPDILLETIHRQALDNPIIAMSMKARTGHPMGFGNYGSSKKITKSMFSTDMAIEADQILTGKNVSRKSLNQWVRKAKGHTDVYPEVGEKLICLRNNRKVGLFNGLLCFVKERKDDFDTSIEYELETEDGKKLICRILRAHFDEYHTPGTIKSLRWWDLQDAEEFDFGYAITVHKSQGSQWDNVILADDKFLSWDRNNRARWLYTAITRAAETITIVQ